MQFGMDQMNLPQIGLGGIASHPRAMFDGYAEMRVAFDAEPRQQSDARLARLAHRVPAAAAHGDDHSVHRALLSGHKKLAAWRSRVLRERPRALLGMRVALNGARKFLILRKL